MEGVKKLSIIVPVYNAEKWLRRCVDSLLNQELPSDGYEIILVDDGSKDGSPEICDDYAAAHTGLVHVIHQPNGGVSMARNAALDVGDFALLFLDHLQKVVPLLVQVLGLLVPRLRHHHPRDDDADEAGEEESLHDFLEKLVLVELVHACTHFRIIIPLCQGDLV